MRQAVPSNPGKRGRRFPIALDFRYSVLGPGRREGGAGRTMWMGSRNLAFRADRPLRHGDLIQMFLAWPVALENGVALQLKVEAVILMAQGRIALARLNQYEFHTRAPAALENRVEYVWQREAAACIAPH